MMDSPGGSLRVGGEILQSYSSIEGSTDPILILDINLATILEANLAACELLEYTNEELRQIPVNAIHLNDMPALQKLVEKVRLQLLASTDEINVLTRTGNFIPVEFTATLIEQKDKPALLVKMHDITMRRACCEASTASGEKVIGVRSVAGFGYFERNLTTDEVKWSDEIFKMFGLPEGSAALGLEPFLELLHPDDRSRVRENASAAFHQKTTLDIVYRVIRPDGELRHIHAVAKYVEDEGGRAAFLGTIYDVTDQVCFESLRREREMRLKLMNDIAVGITSEMTVDEVIKRALTQIHNLFPQFRVCYGLLSNSRMFKFIHSLRPEHVPDITGWEFDLSMVPDFVEAIKCGPVVVENSADDIRLRPLAPQLAKGAFTANLVIPLQHSDNLVGLIGLTSPDPHRWASRIVTTMAEVGRYLSIAIKDAHLVEELRRNEARLEATAEILHAEHKELIKKNIALNQILEHIEREKDLYRDQICESIDSLLMPIISKLKSSDEYVMERDIILLEDALNSIMTKEINVFQRNKSKLTPRELDICGFITKGMSSKEISETLYLSTLTIHKHRESIRHKLQLKNRNINLSTYLRTKEFSSSST